MERESSRTSDDHKNAPNPLIDLPDLLCLVRSLRVRRAAGSTRGCCTRHDTMNRAKRGREICVG